MTWLVQALFGVALAEPMEAVVFPGSGVDRAGVETRLAALRALVPPPSYVATIGARIRIEVRASQVAGLTDAGWNPAAEREVRNVSEAEAVVSAAWAALPSATFLVDLVEDDPMVAVQLRSVEEGVVVLPGRVPAGTYRVIVGDLVLQEFHAEPGAVIRVDCSVVFRNCRLED